MRAKPCRQCDELKPIDEFYPHKQMADGHLNKCKLCIKQNVNDYRHKNLDRIRKYDRMRGRTEEHKAKVRSVAHRYRNTHSKCVKEMKAKFPEKRAAHVTVGNALRDGRLTRMPCEKCGFDGFNERGRSLVQAHHDDYSKPLDVRWLCVTCHGLEHRID